MTVGLSPKLVTAVISAVATYLLGQQVLELPPLAVVGLQALVIGITVWAASPGEVVSSPGVPSDAANAKAFDKHL